MIPEFRLPKLRVVRCSNPALWYANRIGDTFEISHSVPNAIWVKVDGCIDWVYTGDFDFTELEKLDE